MRHIGDYSLLHNLAMVTAISNGGGGGLQFFKVTATYAYLARC